MKDLSEVAVCELIGAGRPLLSRIMRVPVLFGLISKNYAIVITEIVR